MKRFYELTSEETIIDLKKDEKGGIGGFKLNLLNCTQKTWDYFIHILKENEEVSPLNCMLDLKDIACVVGEAGTAYFGVKELDEENGCVTPQHSLIDKLKEKKISSYAVCFVGNCSMMQANRVMNDVNDICSPGGGAYFGLISDDSPYGSATVYIFAA